MRWTGLYASWIVKKIHFDSGQQSRAFLNQNLVGSWQLLKLGIHWHLLTNIVDANSFAVRIILIALNTKLDNTNLIYLYKFSVTNIMTLRKRGAASCSMELQTRLENKGTKRSHRGNRWCLPFVLSVSPYPLPLLSYFNEIWASIMLQWTLCDWRILILWSCHGYPNCLLPMLFTVFKNTSVFNLVLPKYLYP